MGTAFLLWIRVKPNAFNPFRIGNDEKVGYGKVWKIMDSDSPLSVTLFPIPPQPSVCHPCLSHSSLFFFYFGAFVFLYHKEDAYKQRPHALTAGY